MSGDASCDTRKHGGAFNHQDQPELLWFSVSGEAGKDLEAELNAAGPGSCTFVPCDMSKEEDIQVTQVLVLTLSLLVCSL